MSSVDAMKLASGERRKPKPSGSTSRAPSPKICSPDLARFFRIANISSCLRKRAALSMSRPIAISSRADTCKAFSSDKCICLECPETGCKGRGGNYVASLIIREGVARMVSCRFPVCPIRRRCGRSAAYHTLNIAVDESGQLAFGQGAYFLSSCSTVLEQDQGRDATDAELGRHCLVRVHVHLGDLDAASVFLGNFFQDRRDGLAWTAPLCPEINQDRQFGIQDVCFERSIANVFDIFAHIFLK